MGLRHSGDAQKIQWPRVCGLVVVCLLDHANVADVKARM